MHTLESGSRGLQQISGSEKIRGNPRLFSDSNIFPNALMYPLLKIPDLQRNSPMIEDLPETSMLLVFSSHVSWHQEHPMTCQRFENYFGFFFLSFGNFFWICVAVRVVCLFHGANRLIPWFPFIFQRFKRFLGGCFLCFSPVFLGF